MKRTIRRCNREFGEENQASVSFLFSRVGTDQNARTFLEEDLAGDREIGRSVYASGIDLKLKQNAFRSAGNDAGYTTKVGKVVQCLGYLRC